MPGSPGDVVPRDTSVRPADTADRPGESATHRGVIHMNPTESTGIWQHWATAGSRSRVPAGGGPSRASASSTIRGGPGSAARCSRRQSTAAALCQTGRRLRRGDLDPTFGAAGTLPTCTDPARAGEAWAIEALGRQCTAAYRGRRRILRRLLSLYVRRLPRRSRRAAARCRVAVDTSFAPGFLASTIG